MKTERRLTQSVLFSVTEVWAGAACCELFVLEMFLHVLAEVSLVGVGGLADRADVAAVLRPEGVHDDRVHLQSQQILALQNKYPSDRGTVCCNSSPPSEIPN